MNSSSLTLLIAAIFFLFFLFFVLLVKKWNFWCDETKKELSFWPSKISSCNNRDIWIVSHKPLFPWFGVLIWILQALSDND